MDIHPRELKSFVGDLPTLPVVFQELFSRMQDDDAQVSELSDIISRDQALTAKILKLVNSAFYGQASQITTISRAIIIMGFQSVRSAALGVSVFEQFKNLEAASRYATLASLVHMADYLSYHMECPCPGAVAPRTYSRDAAKLINLTPDLANEALGRAREELSEALEILKLLD